MIELNACPKCGKEVEVIEKAGTYYVRCPNCGYGPRIGFTEQYALKEYWTVISEWYSVHPELLREKEKSLC